MEIQRKIENLSQAAALDCEGLPEISRQARVAQFVAHSRVYVTHPQRGKIPVMRIMQTSACEQNCYYCPFQAGRNYQRVWLQPEELASAFDQMQRKKLVDGLFLSSGIVGGGVKAMDRMLDTIELVRRKYEYRGYVHLKVIPGADEAQIERAARLANRLSVNLEGANEKRLQSLAPGKSFTKELLPGLHWVHQHRPTLGSWFKPPSVTTQFVVGPAGEADRELLDTADHLYRQANLARAYYAAFNPVSGTPFADKPKTDSLRQHRLYQADWLLRFYGFKLHEIPFDNQGNLPLVEDPKLAWARIHLSGCPLEINRATRAELLRIPGVGPTSAEAIIKARQSHLIGSLKHLQRLGVQTGRAAPYILLNGRQPSYQLPLAGL